MRLDITLVAVAVLLFPCPHAHALAQRTFVSTSGNDANTGANCSLVAPCRSFASAMSVTATDGEIVVLDSGGYGPVTITQGVTIDAAAGLYAGISVTAGTGVTVNTPGANVTLRGLTINGQGGTTGVSVLAAGSIRIERCTLRKFVGTAIVSLAATDAIEIVDVAIADSGSNGIDIALASRLLLRNVAVTRSFGDGVKIENVTTATIIASVISASAANGFRVNAAAGAAVRATFEQVTVTDSRFAGIIYFIMSSDGSIDSTIRNSTFSHNALSGTANGAIRAFLTSSATGPLHVAVVDSVIQANVNAGVQAASGAGTVVTVSRSSLTDNGGVALQQSAGTLYTTSDNVVRGNNGQETTNQTVGTITTLAPL